MLFFPKGRHRNSRTVFHVITVQKNTGFDTSRYVVYTVGHRSRVFNQLIEGAGSISFRAISKLGIVIEHNCHAMFWSKIFHISLEWHFLCHMLLAKEFCYALR